MNITRFDILRLALLQWMLSFCDHSIKSAFGILITFGGYRLFGLDADVALVLGALALAVPFVLIAGFAGRLAQHYPAAVLIKWTRICEVPLSVLAANGLLAGIMPLLLICIFLYSAQSVIFTVSKLVLLPQCAKGEALVALNGTLQSATLVGVLCGLLFGSLMITFSSEIYLCLTLLGFSIFGSLISYFLPVLKPVDPLDLPGQTWNPVHASMNALDVVFSDTSVRKIALCITWFWTMGLVLTTLLPDVARQDLNISAHAANLLIASFVAGIVAGGWIIKRMVKRENLQRIISISAVGMAIFCFDLSFAISGYADNSRLTTVESLDFLSTLSGLRIIADLTAIAFFGAIFVAPLYAALQSSQSELHRPVIMSGSVTLDALCTTIMAALLIFGLSIGLTFLWLLVMLAAINLGIAFFIKIDEHILANKAH